MRLGLLVASFLSAVVVMATAAQSQDRPPDGATYWTIPGFKGRPLLGPEKAKGVVFWSHGVNGKEPQYQGSPPPVIALFAAARWDVIKINRNPTYETGW